jgi:hypothetical protein
VILNSIMLFTRSYKIYEYSFFLGIAGALQAFLTPDAVRRDKGGGGNLVPSSPPQPPPPPINP